MEVRKGRRREGGKRREENPELDLFKKKQNPKKKDWKKL